MPSSLSTGVAVLVLDGDDLVVERTGILCGGGLLVRVEGELVERGAVEAPLLGDHLGAGALVRGLGVAGAEGLRVRMPTVGQRGAHRGARHRLDAASDDDVVVAGHHAGRGEVHRLLAGSALPVDGHAGNALRPARREHRGAGDVERLLAGLHDAAPDDVVDERRVDARALDEAVEHLRRQFAGMHARQPAVALADGRSDGLDDDGFSHDNSPSKWVVLPRK